MGDALMLRIGVASIVQETNTFSPRTCELADFRSQSLHVGEEAAHIFKNTNTELGGAIQRVEHRGALAIPLIHAWAMSSGRLTAETFDALQRMLEQQIERVMPLDGLVLSLHGAMAAEGKDNADAELLMVARCILGSGVVIGVCLDLHANVTPTLVQQSDILVGFHTYPHVDQAETGARIADLVLDQLEERSLPVIALAKRAMLVPPEAQTPDGPFGELRVRADRATTGTILDISLFPVQPWLDVDGLGFAVTVVADGDLDQAQNVAEHFANMAWEMRHEFSVDLVEPLTALDRVRASRSRPVLLSESADSPTAGAAADSPAMVQVLLGHGRDLRAYVTVVDPTAVAACFHVGTGLQVDVRVGCSLDQRFHHPVRVQGVIQRLGSGALQLTGPVFRGMVVNMGRWAVVNVEKLSVLLTERPAHTFDPETYRKVGLPPEDADVIVVRSATLFRAGWVDVAGDIFILDLPGASTPRLNTLTFERAPRPLYPLEDS